jgi:hypothetical protein
MKTFLGNLTLRYKLFGAFAVMSALVAITGVFGIMNIELVGTRVVDMMRTSAALEKAVLQLEIHQKACRVALLEASRVPNDPGEFRSYAATYQKKRELFKKNLNLLLLGDQKLALAPAAPGSPLERMAKSVRASWGDFEGVADEFLAYKGALLRGLKPGVIDQKAMVSLADAKLNALVTKRIMEASEAAKLDIDDLADYLESQMFSAVKGGIMSFSKSLARSVAPKVRVNILAPGWIETEFAATTMDPEYYRNVLESTPLKRWGTPDDVARSAVFLASSDSAFLTGQMLMIGGGVVM